MKSILATLMIISLTTCLAEMTDAPAPMPFAKSPTNALTLTPKAPKLDVNSYVVMDATTTQIVASQDMDKKIAPASLTKLMSLFIVAHALKTQQIKIDDPVLISNHAWKAEGSRMFIKPQTKVPVRLLIQGTAVVSGNDSTIALAEHIAGTEENFVAMMNQIATSIGMKNSHFTNSTGLPNPNHYTTAHDLAVLAQRWIHDYPKFYKWFSQKWFKYNNIKQPNRNRLLWRDASVDGMKTGHTQSAGYCLIASAMRKQSRFITVVIGAASDQSRSEQSEQALNYGFHFFATNKILSKKQKVLDVTTLLGQKKVTPVGTMQAVNITTPKYSTLKYTTKFNMKSPLLAPIKMGQQVGSMSIILDGATKAQVPLFALESNPKGKFFSTLVDRIKLMLYPPKQAPLTLK